MLKCALMLYDYVTHFWPTIIKIFQILLWLLIDNTLIKR